MARKNSKKYSKKVLLHKNSKDNATINSMATTKIEEVQETFVSVVDDIKNQVVSYLFCFGLYLFPCSFFYSY